MNSCIDRVKAQEDIRSLSVAVCGQGGEIAIDRREKLVLEMGTVVTIVGDGSNPLEAALDKSGLDDLKMMAGERIGQ